MKLYLSSMPIRNPDYLTRLVGKNKAKVSLVPNAWDVYPKERKQTEIGEISKALDKFGFKVHLLDLASLNFQSIHEDLKGSEVIYVMGGNTFYLNYQLHHSGFKMAVKGLLKQGLVYCGDSAGAVVVGSTLHGIEYLDDPKLAPQVVWDGLKLVNFGILPHWGWERYGPSLGKAKQEMDRYTHVSVIGNDQALVIDGEELEVVAAV